MTKEERFENKKFQVETIFNYFLEINFLDALSGTFKTIVDNTINDKNIVGLNYLLRDFKEMTRDMPISEKRKFFNKMKELNVDINIGSRDLKKVLKDIMKSSKINSEFEYQLLNEYFNDLKDSSKISILDKKKIINLLKDHIKYKTS